MSPSRAGNRIAVRIEPRMAERRRQGLDLIDGQRVLAAFRDRVHGSKRQPRLVREVALEQAVRANDLPRHALAFAGQLELLPAREDEPLLLHHRERAASAADRSSRSVPLSEANDPCRPRYC